MKKEGRTGLIQVILRSPYGLPPYHLLLGKANFGGNGKPGFLIVADREKYLTSVTMGWGAIITLRLFFSQ